jgi:hypothetical protein
MTDMENKPPEGPGPVAGKDCRRELDEIKADIKAVKRGLDERSAACGDNQRKISEAFETIKAPRSKNAAALDVIRKMAGTPDDATRRESHDELEKIQEDIADTKAMLAATENRIDKPAKTAKRGAPGRPFRDPRDARGDEIRRAGLAEILALAMRDAPKRKG